MPDVPLLRGPRKTSNDDPSTWRVRKLLKFFGYPLPKPHSRLSFFQQHGAELEWIHHDCRKLYLKMAKEAHPDNMGNHESSVFINVAWARLTHIFSHHCPSIKSPTFRPPDNSWKPRPSTENPRGRPPGSKNRETGKPRKHVLTPARLAVLARMSLANRNLTPARREASRRNVRKMLAARGIIPKDERPPSPPVVKVKKEPVPYNFTPSRQKALHDARKARWANHSRVNLSRGIVPKDE